MKTINMNVAIFGKPEYKDITLEEYSKRWTDHTSQIAWLPDTPEGMEKYKEVKRLVQELIEEAFNGLWERQNR